MSGICERGLTLMFKKFGILGALSELLEPHFFRKNWSLRIRNNWSAPLHAVNELTSCGLKTSHGLGARKFMLNVHFII